MSVYMISGGFNTKLVVDNVMNKLEHISNENPQSVTSELYGWSKLGVILISPLKQYPIPNSAPNCNPKK